MPDHLLAIFAEAGTQPAAGHSATGLVLIFGLLLALIAFRALRGLLALVTEALEFFKRPLESFGGLFLLATVGCLLAFLLLPWHG